MIKGGNINSQCFWGRRKKTSFLFLWMYFFGKKLPKRPVPRGVFGIINVNKRLSSQIVYCYFHIILPFPSQVLLKL